jgi:hypothetical protein
MLPLTIKGSTLFLAMLDPDDSGVIEKLDFILNRPLRPLRASSEQLAEAINRHYGRGWVRDALPTSAQQVREPARTWTILIEDVSRYLLQTAVPIRRGLVPFSCSPLAARSDGRVEVEASSVRTHTGFRMGYVLSATLDSRRLEEPITPAYSTTRMDHLDSRDRGRLLLPTLHEVDLHDIAIWYTDDRMEAEGLTEAGTLFRVSAAENPQASWMPRYSDTPERLAKQMRERFARGDFNEPWQT